MQVLVIIINRYDIVIIVLSVLLVSELCSLLCGAYSDNWFLLIIIIIIIIIILGNNVARTNELSFLLILIATILYY